MHQVKEVKEMKDWTKDIQSLREKIMIKGVELEEEKESGEFEKYTKKERVKKEKDLQSMGLKFEGLKNLDKMPNAVFIADIVKDKLALKEAFENKVEAIAIVDSNADPTLVDFPIPANDDAIPSVSYILSKIKAAYLNQ